MATDEEYLRQIRKYKTHKKLLRLWEQILQRATPDWDAGKALEYLVLRAFEIEGADVRWPFGVELDTHLVEQIDGVVYTANVNCMAESKDWTIPIPIEPIAKLRKASDEMKCHVVVEGAADVELVERLLTDLPLVDRPRVVASGGRTGCIARARSILAIKREPVAIVVDADTTESRNLNELHAYFDSEMRAVSTSAKWRVFVIRPELEVMLFLAPAAIERFFGMQLTAEQRVRAEYTPRMILDELAKDPQKSTETRIQLIQSLTEDELVVLRDHPEISEIRKFVVSVAGSMLATHA